MWSSFSRTLGQLGRSAIAAIVITTLVSCASEKRVADVIFSNVTVIDAVSGERSQQDVIVLGDKIISVEDHGSMQSVSAKIVIRGDDKFLIPGLWDAHVHLTYTEGLGDETFFPLAIAHGVTSLRDTGGHIDKLATARARAKTDPYAPDLYVSGPLIDGPLRVYAGQTPFNPDISVGVGSAQEARDIVDTLIAADVDFIKAYEMLSQPTFEALVAYAQDREIPVSAHVPLSMTAFDAAQAGVGDMQHLRNLELSCGDDIAELRAVRRDMLDKTDAPEPASLRRQIHNAQRANAISTMTSMSCDELIATLAEYAVAQTPTLTISRFQTHGLYGDEAYRKSFDLLPSNIAEGWKARSIQFADPTTDASALAFDDWITGLIPTLAAQNVPIMAGTDAPIGFLTPGASLHQELFLLVDAGLSPSQAISAATIEPARFFGLQDRVGAISPGQAADLVLLSENPIDDIRNIETIDLVMKRGVVIERDALDELLLTNRNVN